MKKNNMNDTSKIASAINDLKNVKIPVKIDGENKTITKITPVNGHDGMYYFEVAEKNSILSRIVMPFDDEYDACMNAVNDFLNKKTVAKNNDEMIKQLNSEIRAFNKTITTSTTNKEIWNKKLELSKKYGLKTIGRCVSENEYEYMKIAKFKENDECLYIHVGKKAEAKKTDNKKVVAKNTEVKKTEVKKPVAKKIETKKTVAKKILATRKNKYFYAHVPSFMMKKKDIKNVLGLIAKGGTNFSLKLNHDFVINGFNYLSQNQKDEVVTASLKYFNENKNKHIEMKKNILYAINDAKLILKYL